MIRRTLLGLVVMASLLPAPRARADGLTLSRKQYQLYKDYKDALDDDRVKKMKEKDRVPAIARNFKVPVKELQEAIDLGEKEAAQIEPTETAALKTTFAGTALDGHVGEVSVDAAKGHIVAYVTWTNADPAQLNQEACVAAIHARAAAPLAGTYFLTAVDGSKAKVFNVLISNENAERIKEDKIVDFASTRYAGLFEKRKVSP
jgi:hypothetical protein